MQRLKDAEENMAEGEGLEPSSPKAPVFKTGGLANYPNPPRAEYLL